MLKDRVLAHIFIRNIWGNIYILTFTVWVNVGAEIAIPALLRDSSTTILVVAYSSSREEVGGRAR